MSIKEEVYKMKSDAPFMAASSIEDRNRALLEIANSLQNRSGEIFEANHKDLENAENMSISPSVIKRLKFDENKLKDVLSGINQLINLEDPLGKLTIQRELDDELILTRISCPIGVIGVIFESRPDALVQISTLCIKSGNCCILKGGKESANTNSVLFNIIHDSVVAAGLPFYSMLQASSHSEIDELLECDGYVDLLIPRGSNGFVSYIMNHTKIPVMGHADGICHIYVDEYADYDKAISIIADAKTQYTAACNAVETLLINRKIADKFLPRLNNELKTKGVVLKGTKEAGKYIDIEIVDESEFIEYLDLCASVKIVESTIEAINHINKYGSHHTDCIITEDEKEAEYFMQMVDSAGVYHNCSTRFADGYRYGFGAEVGISTGKLHARGPVGLEGLVTYKYRLKGNGHIVADYAEGRKIFKHKDIN